VETEGRLTIACHMKRDNNLFCSCGPVSDHRPSLNYSKRMPEKAKEKQINF